MIKVSRCTILLFLFLAACGEEKITVYTIPKEESPQAPQVEQAANNSSEITWTAPKDWQQQPATPMRQGSFLVSDENGAKADISVAGFPGDVGGDLANVNRWRGQINLPPIDDAGLNSALQRIDMNGVPASLVAIDEKSDGSGRKIIAVILHREDKTWFFKMMGDVAMVVAQKKSFLDFLNTVRFRPDQGGAPALAQATPQLADTPMDASSKPTWKLPPGWQEQPASGMRVGSFSIVEGGSKADISLVGLTGDAGGLLANINRWRGQISLPNMTEADMATLVTRVDVGGSSAAVVDIASEAPVAGSKNRSRILGAIIERGDRSWFVKATGDDTLLEKHKSEFLDFVKSIQFPDHG